MNSELSYTSSPAAVEPEPAPQNHFSRLIGVWFSPGETFAEIGRAPRVLIPTLLLVILASVGAYLLTDRVGYENIVRKQFESMVNSGMIPQDKAEEIIQQSLTPEKITMGKIQSAAGGAIGIIVIMLIISGLFKAYTMMVGSENRFKQVFSVTSYTYLAISLIGTAVMLLSIYLKDPAEIDLYNPVGTNLGAFLPMMVEGLPKFVIGLASYLDIFGIWRIALLSIGYAAVSRKMKTGTAAVFVIILYILSALLGAGVASMFG
jgi:hypothetical protein